MTYRGIGCPRAPVQLFRESIVALGPTSFRPISSVAKLSAFGDVLLQIAYSLKSDRARAQIRAHIPRWKIRKNWRAICAIRRYAPFGAPCALSGGVGRPTELP